MKTKDLIAALQENDPSGEVECCVGNAPIFFLANMPAWYDGKLQVLVQDHSKDPYYNIVGAKRTNKGRKIVLHTHSIEDYISDNPEDAKIDYSECGDEFWVNRYREADEKVRQAMLAIQLDVTMGGFFRWASGILASLKPDSKPEDFKRMCADFFMENRELLEEDHPLPTRKETHGDQTYDVHPSIMDCEIAHWTNVIEFTSGAWVPIMKLKEATDGPKSEPTV